MTTGGGGKGEVAAAGVGVVEDAGELDDEGSSMGGRGRKEMSGRGLNVAKEVGVGVERGGHSWRGGSWGTFSL